MLKRLKIMASALVLAGLALPVIAQQSSTTGTAAHAVGRKPVSTPGYLIAFGHVLARIDNSGATKFKYQQGRLASEVLPNGTVGTYQYDASKFAGIVYTDGRYITLSYKADGSLSGLTTNSGARVAFSATGKMTPLAAFKTIQNGINALQAPTTSYACKGTDDDSTCTIVVPGASDEPPPDTGAYGGFGGAANPDPLSGNGEGGGGGGVSNPPGETPEQCVANVCKPVKNTFLQYCAIATNGPTSFKACIDKSMEYDQRCRSSCVTNDWSWLDWWLFFY